MFIAALFTIAKKSGNKTKVYQLINGETECGYSCNGISSAIKKESSTNTRCKRDKP